MEHFHYHHRETFTKSECLIEEIKRSRATLKTQTCPLTINVRHLLFIVPGSGQHLLVRQDLTLPPQLLLLLLQLLLLLLPDAETVLACHLLLSLLIILLLWPWLLGRPAAAGLPVLRSPSLLCVYARTCAVLRAWCLMCTTQ